MALLKIYEPGQTPQPHHQEEIAVGIDLGTTNSLIAISVNQKPQILLDDNGHFMQPSIVAVVICLHLVHFLRTDKAHDWT